MYGRMQLRRTLHAVALELRLVGDYKIKEGSSMPVSVNEIWLQVHLELRAFIARRVPSDTEVDDVLQEVFLRMHRGLDSLKDPRRLVSWVFQITRHAIADYYRSPKRRREVAAGLAADLEASQTISLSSPMGNSEASEHIRKELAACIRPMMEHLSNPYREAVTLVELDGLTHQAAAKRLGLSLSGMKSRVQRGRRELRMLIEECCVVQLDRRGSITDYSVRKADGGPCGPPLT